VHDVKVGPSSIEGLGIFPVSVISAGDRIREVNVIREITLECPLRPELGERAEHCDYPDGKVVLIGEPDRYLNHSCDPNGWVLYEANRCFIVARRDIALGEEITCDYSINVTGGDTWPCNCGAARCRGRVTGDFFQLPEELQREYRTLLAEWFVQRHAERLKSLDGGT
jgi:hypothetical protein